MMPAFPDDSSSSATIGAEAEASEASGVIFTCGFGGMITCFGASCFFSSTTCSKTSCTLMMSPLKISEAPSIFLSLIEKPFMLWLSSTIHESPSLWMMQCLRETLASEMTRSFSVSRPIEKGASDSWYSIPVFSPYSLPFRTRSFIVFLTPFVL